MKGFDTGGDCSKYAARLAGLGYRFGARYLAGEGDWRVFRRTEAEAMGRAGLLIVSIWETTSDPNQFTAENGRKHAGTALARARAVGQPEGSAIYFAVDTDAAKVANVIAYFEAIPEDFPYAVGIYGPGLMCSTIRDETSLAEYAWLSNAKAWPGYAQFKGREDILQGLPFAPFKPDAFAIDGNDSAADSGFGEWSA